MADEINLTSDQVSKLQDSGFLKEQTASNIRSTIAPEDSGNELQTILEGAAPGTAAGRQLEKERLKTKARERVAAVAPDMIDDPATIINEAAEIKKEQIAAQSAQAEETEAAVDREILERIKLKENAQIAGLEDEIPEGADVDEVISSEEEDIIKQTPASEEDIALSTQPTLAEVDEASKDIRQEVARSEALENEKDKQQEVIELAEAETEQDLIKAIDQINNQPYEDFWANKTTGEKVIAAIGLALSALGGQGHNAFNIINTMVKNDLNLQKETRENKLQSYHLKLEAVKNKVKERMAGIKQRNELLKGEKLFQDLQAAQLQNKQMITKQKSLKKLQEMRNQGNLSPSQRSELERRMVDSYTKEERKRYVPGYGLAKDAKSAENANTAIDFGDQAIAQVNNIRKLLAEFGNFEVIDRGAVRAETSARRSLQLQLKELFNLGVLNGPDLELLEEFTGGDFFSPLTTSSSKEAALSSVEEFIKNRVNSSLKRANLPKTGKSKLDAILASGEKKGLTRAESLQTYKRLVEKGQIK